MNIDEQTEAARTWEPGDPGPRPYDPSAATDMRTAALLERTATWCARAPKPQPNYTPPWAMTPPCTNR